LPKNSQSLNFLEIGTGPLARLAIKINGFANHITALDIYPQVIKEMQKNIKQKGLEKRITPILSKEKTKLPFNDNEFNLIYTGWISSKLLSNPEYLDELSRVSKNDIILLMPGINGDFPEMIDLIKKENEKSKRIELKDFMTNYLQEKGYKIDTTKQTTLRLDFQKKQTIQQTMYCMDFDNSLTENQKQTLNNFLNPKTRNFKDNLYIFHAWKE